MSLGHDGHSVHCTACLAPLRAAALVPVQVVFSPDGTHVQQSSANVDETDAVVCTNCENSLGTVASVAADVARLTVEHKLIRDHMEAGV